VTLEDELQRVIPVIEALRKHTNTAISIDTSKTGVMSAAVAAGASMVNDVYGLRAPGAVEACARLDVPVCVMHMQGEPRTMQSSPQYENVLGDIKVFLQQRVDTCVQAGIRRQRIIIDPGFGFGKTLEHNLNLLRQLDGFGDLGLPLLVGLSRKSMFGQLLGAPVDQRLAASVAAAVLAWSKGARIFRVHDVKPTVDALKVCAAMNDAGHAVMPG
jgi:dihydropteroate synthase